MAESAPLPSEVELGSIVAEPERIATLADRAKLFVLGVRDEASGR